MNGLLFYVLGALLVFCLGYFIYEVIKFAKTNKEDKLSKKTLTHFGIIIGSFSILLMGVNFSLFVFNSWTLTVSEILFTIFGSLIFGFSILSMVLAIYLHLKRPNLVLKQKKIVHIGAYILGVVAFISFFLMTEGYANHLVYPLIKGITFTAQGIVFTRYNDLTAPEGLSVEWYGLVIVSGAILVYLIGDYRFYKAYHRHGLLESTFFVAFPMGIIGARLWSCLVLEPDIYLSNPIQIFLPPYSGLAIFGGIVLGVSSGVAFIYLFRKYINVRWAFDVLAPSILIAQSIGRFGNFFNHEVYGGLVDVSSFWFLPTVIKNQMYPTFLNGIPVGSQIQLPLFFIEGMTNLIGYFVIVYAVGRGLRKWTSLGDLGMGYFIWYGMTRVFLEPLRNSQFGYQQDWIAGFGLAAVGLIGIIIFHTYDYLRKKKGLELKVPVPKIDETENKNNV